MQYEDILAYNHYLKYTFLKLTMWYMETQHKKSYFKWNKKTKTLLDHQIIKSWPLPLCKVGRNALERVHENTPFLGSKWPIWPEHKCFQENNLIFVYLLAPFIEQNLKRNP